MNDPPPPSEVADSTLQLPHKAVEDTTTAEHLCPSEKRIFQD